MNARRKGFTIVEVLVVVVILGLLSVFIVPSVFKKLGKAKSGIAKSQVALIGGAIEQFAIDCGRLPTDDEGLEALLVAPADLEDKWGPKYLKASQIIDPWGRPYIYVSEGTINVGSYDLISLGADGEEEGEGDNKDIYND